MGVTDAVQATAFAAAACRSPLDPFAALFTSDLTPAQRRLAATGSEEVLWRTKIIDSILTELLADGPPKTVVNIGAGLCARPYRLDLSGCRELIEIDREDLITFKSNILSGYAESCPVRRIAADARLLPPLDDPHVILTEGLLVYLTPDELRTFAASLPGHHWIADIVSASSAAVMATKSSGLCLSGLDSLDVFTDAGWTITDYRPLPIARPHETRTSHSVVDGVLLLTRCLITHDEFIFGPGGAGPPSDPARLQELAARHARAMPR